MACNNLVALDGRMNSIPLQHAARESRRFRNICKVDRGLGRVVLLYPVRKLTIDSSRCRVIPSHGNYCGHLIKALGVSLASGLLVSQREELLYVATTPALFTVKCSSDYMLKTYNHSDIGIRSPHAGQQARVRLDDSRSIPFPDIDIVGSEENAHDVGAALLHPAIDIVPGNVVGLPPRVALVVRIEAGRRAAAALEARHRAHEVYLVC